MVDKDKTQTIQYTSDSSYSPEACLNLLTCESSYSDDSSLTDDDDGRCFGATKYDKFLIRDLSGVKVFC